MANSLWERLSRVPGLPYLSSVGLALLALVLTLVIGPVNLPDPSMLFLVAVMMAAWWGGLGPGLVAAVLSTLTIDYLLVPPAYSRALGLDDLLRLCVFAASALAASYLRTAGRRSRSALLESEERFGNMADTAPVMIWMAGPDTQCQFVSKGWLNFTGRTLREELGQGWLESIHPDDRERCRAIFLRAVLDRSGFKKEFRMLRRGGQYRWILETAVPRLTSDGAFAGYIGSCIDFTERKQSESELAARVRQQAMVAELGEQGLAGLEAGALMERAASRVAEILDMERAAVLELLPDRSGFLLRAGFGWEPGLVGRATLPAGEGTQAGATLLSKKPQVVEDFDKETRFTGPQELSKERLRSGVSVAINGREAAFGVLMAHTSRERRFSQEDVHFIQAVAHVLAAAIERKRSEEERALLLERERTACAEAESSSRAKDEFLATISHELRTPLHSILGWASMLRTQKLSEAQGVRAVEIIERNATAQARIVDDLLDVSRLIQGKLRLKVRQVDLAPVIEAAVEAGRPASDAKAIRLEVALDPRVDPVTGDPDRLQQVVWNLVSNAIKFTPEGGRIEVRLERTAYYVQIKVKDSGAGISSQFLPQVFDLFRQADQTSTRRHRGLGLGLCIVRRLVELHGGTIQAESRGPDQGSTFTVSLPVRAVREPGASRGDCSAGREKGAAAAEARESGQAALAGVRVLVVDDEADARDLLSTVLRQYGAEVMAVGSAAEALESLSEESPRPDVLVCDIAMPGQDGYMLIRSVRTMELKGGDRIPAIALTAYSRAADRVHALSAGFQNHVTKPVDPAELAAVVGSLAQKRRNGRS